MIEITRPLTGGPPEVGNTCPGCGVNTRQGGHCQDCRDRIAYHILRQFAAQPTGCNAYCGIGDPARWCLGCRSHQDT